MTEHEIVSGCIENNPLAQKMLFDMYSKKMMGVCLRYASCAEEADDMLQKGFIKVFENITSFNGSGSLEGWVRKVMVNASLDHLRKYKKLKNNVDIEGNEYHLGAEDHTLDSMQAQEILKIIQRLPDGFRTVFNMFAIEGYSHKEIAKELNISINTSKSQFSRARAYLRKIIIEEKILE